MKLRSSNREEVDINLTPLIDVVFLLLIFFMVSTTFDRNSQLSLELPSVSADAQKVKDEPIDVSIDAQGRFYVDGRQLVNTQIGSLMQALKAAAGDDGEAPAIVVSADANTPHQSVVTVLDAASRLGLLKIRFAARIEAEESQ